MSMDKMFLLHSAEKLISLPYQLGRYLLYLELSSNNKQREQIAVEMSV
jgi:hypothetical protein